MPYEIRRPLILDGPEFTIRAENFGRLISVPEFRERLFADPAAVAREEFGIAADSATMSNVNKMTFALLSDPAFNEWSMAFQERVDQVLADQEITDVSVLTEHQARLSEEFADTVQQFLDPNLVERLKPGQLVSEGDVAVILLTFIVIVVVVAVAAAAQKPDGYFNRRSVQLLIRQLDDETLANVSRQAQRYDH